MIPQAEACRRVREYVYSRWKNQTIAAAQLGCQQGRLSEILAGKRPIPPWLLREVGMIRRRVWIYEEGEAP